MAKEGHIHIIGGIGTYGEVSMQSVANQVKELGDVDKYLVLINSGGGEVYEGYAIRDFLLSLGKPITTRGIGIVGSIASVIFLAGTKRQLYTNTRFLIHNPFTFGEGDADELQRRADELRVIENDLLDFYHQETGTDKETLKALMQEDKLIDSSLANELKFATEILEPVKAYATIKTIKTNTMSKIGKIFKDAFASLKAHGVVMNETIMTTDGKELEIEMAGDTISEGDMVTLDGESADGNFELADGTKIVCESGVITSVEKPSAESDDDVQNQINELKKVVADLTNQNKALATENEEMIAEVEVITNHLKKLKITNVVAPKKVTAFNRQGKVEAKVELSNDEVKARIKELGNKSKKNPKLVY